MQLESELLDDQLLEIKLHVRRDIEGTQAIDMQFTALTATKKAAILVNMTKVEFWALIGMRTLLSCAKAVANRGGKMVMYKPQPRVLTVLQTSGLDSLIPV